MIQKMSKEYTVIYPNNKKDHYTLPTGVEYLTLDTAQNLVGGNIEILILGDKMMIVNEDGINLKLEYNKIASELCGYASINGIVIYGDDDLLD